MRTTVAIAALILACATNASGQVCGGAGLTVKFTPDHPNVGDTVQITLTNTSSACIYGMTNSCVYQSVHKVDCSGQAVVPFRNCASVGQILGPGASAKDKWDLKDSLGVPVPAGTYAFKIEVKDTTVGTLVTLCPTLDVGGCVPPPTLYGSASAGAGGLSPEWEVSGGPMIGDPGYSLKVKNALGGAPALILVGATQANVPATWGTLLVGTPMIQLPVPLGGTAGQAGAGTVTLTFGVPNDATLVGLSAHLQTLVADPFSSGGISHTPGLKLTLCS